MRFVNRSLRTLAANRVLGATTLLLAVVSVGAAVFAVVTTGLIARDGGCGFDGQAYCAMAEGRAVPVPYSRRILYPLVLRLLTNGNAASVVSTARILTPLIVVGSAGLLAILTVRFGRVLGLSSTRSLLVASVAACVLLLSPYGFHFSLMYPVYTDAPATALLLAWMVLVGSTDRWLRLCSIGTALACCLCREDMVFVIGLSAAVWCALNSSKYDRFVGVLTLAAAAVGGLLAFTAQSDGTVYVGSTLDHIAVVIGYFSTPHGLHSLVAMVVFGVGLLPLLALSGWRASRGRGLGASLFRRPDVLGIFATAAATVASLLTGTDIDRYLIDGLVVALPLILTCTALDRRWDPLVAACVLGSVIEWPTFVALNGAVPQFLRWFAIYAAAHSEYQQQVTFEGVVGFVGLIGLGIALFLGVRRPAARHE